MNRGGRGGGGAANALKYVVKGSFAVREKEEGPFRRELWGERGGGG